MEKQQQPVPLAKAVFLDRDGVLNVERGEYTWRLQDFEVCPGVPEALALLKQHGYLLVVVTNQAGITKGLYTKEDVLACHVKLQAACGHLIDALYMAPGHPSKSESLSRKPNSLMLEKAIARFHLYPAACWLVGDQPRDLQAAQSCGISGILVGPHPPGTHPQQKSNLLEAAQFIVAKTA
ncbi:D-glycero-alpha-D-manno-heptose-1,7-bisphosphate 7-phosphatase [Rufibacter glacialis]|uniref:D,D-heptose 1,7-bisphosphate phosphatase n=1 Tax=Rufibacter glacialis TaxID=1259555 RepID=A0A5M8QCQ9_9BACT|nr:HAD family hydrolase [Rufibacter glacialis]KAA6432242.1 HAD family hydrolase [Rufibacter glacialis]GGK77045.1 D,D-heptose 1,7-bisphosphate phosphatase [Rufibacter glacialis]